MTTAPKKTTTRKPAARKAPAKKATATPRAPRPTQKIIRNLRGTTVNARLYSETPKDPFRITLSPRGQNGDTAVVPAKLINDITFVKGVNVLWEVITSAELQSIEYASVGYLGRTDAPTIIRPDENTVMTAKDWKADKGKSEKSPQDREIVQRERGPVEQTERPFGTGMHTVDVPGADTGLHQLLAEGNKALPPDVDLGRNRVVVERVKG